MNDATIDEIIYYKNVEYFYKLIKSRFRDIHLYNVWIVCCISYNIRNQGCILYKIQPTKRKIYKSIIYYRIILNILQPNCIIYKIHLYNVSLQNVYPTIWPNCIKNMHNNVHSARTLCTLFSIMYVVCVHYVHYAPYCKSISYIIQPKVFYVCT
jgi:hypothetical protein